MPVRKITISLPEEIDEALILASVDMKSNKSRVIEVFLREHPRVQKYVEIIRAEPDATIHGARGRKRGHERAAKTKASA